jgi:hypothetical protein
MLPIERKILRELSSVYLAGGLIVLGVYMTLELGSIPQWLTTIVASFALGIAAVSVRSQREIARKRAAFDFFAKTEMDKHTLAQHKSYKNAVEKLTGHLQAKNL